MYDKSASDAAKWGQEVAGAVTAVGRKVRKKEEAKSGIHQAFIGKVDVLHEDVYLWFMFPSVKLTSVSPTVCRRIKTMKVTEEFPDRNKIKTTTNNCCDLSTGHS